MANDRLNLNTATVSELTTLPGIGNALARRIVAHRGAVGPFRIIDEFAAVAGIPNATADAIRERVTVTHAQPPGDITISVRARSDDGADYSGHRVGSVSPRGVKSGLPEKGGHHVISRRSACCVEKENHVVTDLKMTLRVQGISALDEDLLASGAKMLAEGLMELEVSEKAGADRYERSGKSVNHRNGYRNRLWQTRVGGHPPSGAQAAQRRLHAQLRRAAIPHREGDVYGDSRGIHQRRRWWPLETV